MKESSLYKLLNDKEWLLDKYNVQKLSTAEISKLVGCSNADTVARNLKRLQIPIRSISERRRVKNNDFLRLNLPVINGSLLGDAYISKPHSKNWNSSLCKKNIYYDHVLFFAKQILEKNAEKRIFGPIEPSGNLSSNGKPYYFLNTYKHPELTQLRKLWYPNGKKIIPRNIEITSETLLHWFLDDGYSYIVKYKGKTNTKNHIRVCLCSDCFTKNDLFWMRDLLKTKFNLYFHLGKKVNGHILILRESQSNDFFALIGPCPVKSMEYKWKHTSRLDKLKEFDKI